MAATTKIVDNLTFNHVPNIFAFKWRGIGFFLVFSDELHIYANFMVSITNDLVVTFTSTMGLNTLNLAILSHTLFQAVPKH